MRSYTPLRYPGGKSKLYPYVVKLIEANYELNPVYIEPFAGGSGLAFKLLLNNKVSKIYINDFDKAIYSFWYSIFNHTDEFIELINSTEISVEQWLIQKQKYAAGDCTILERGFATFYLNRTNRSGILTAGPIGGYKQDGNYKIDCRFNKDNLIVLIQKLVEFKEKVVISNEDASVFLKRVDRLENNSLIYLDPPYVEKGKELYKNSFNENDHKRLAKKVSFLKNKWLVTYDDVELIEKIYNNYSMIKFDLSYVIQTKRVAKEIAIFSEKFSTIPPFD